MSWKCTDQKRVGNNAQLKAHKKYFIEYKLIKWLNSSWLFIAKICYKNNTQIVLCTEHIINVIFQSMISVPPQKYSEFEGQKNIFFKRHMHCRYSFHLMLFIYRVLLLDKHLLLSQIIEYDSCSFLTEPRRSNSPLFFRKWQTLA